MSVLDGIGDVLGDVGDAIGGAGKWAYDNLLPHTQRTEGGYGLTDLFSGMADAARSTGVGALTALPDLLTSDQMSWGQKLLWGGLLVGGAAYGAHEWHAAQKLERQFALQGEQQALGRALAIRPSRSEAALRIGLGERWTPSTLEGEMVRRQFPGLKARTADVLGSADVDSTVSHLTGLPLGGEHLPAASGIFKSYMDSLPLDPSARLAAAQADWAKLQLAIDHGIITKGENPVLVKGWNAFKENPGSLTEGNAAKAQEFLTHVAQISDATRGLVQPDMTVDAVTKVTKMQILPSGEVVVHLDTPIGWTADKLSDSKIRSARIKSLNVSQLATRGERILKDLYLKAMESPESRAKYLDRGHDWYGTVHREIAARLDMLAEKMPWLDMERLTAAVSLTSAATDWEQNIDLAVRTLEVLSERPDFRTPEFQSWLKSSTGARSGDGSAFQAAFDEVHAGIRNREEAQRVAALKAKLRKDWEKLPKESRPERSEYVRQGIEGEEEGNFLSADDLKKTLRLYNEKGADIFAATDGPKQKNLYLNLLDPSSADPVTVDRHAHDIFFGLATHSDFKLLEQNHLGESNYELIADVYRRVAAELGVKPHEVQGVTWQAWRYMKEEWNPRSNSYTRGRGPFSLPEPDGSPNAVLEAISGRPSPLVHDVLEAVPQGVTFVRSAKGDGLTVLPGGDVGVTTRLTHDNLLQWRYLRPAADLGDGVVAMGPGYPLPVRDLDAAQRMVDGELSTHHLERMSSMAWDGQHPTERPGRWVVMEVPDGATVNWRTPENIVRSGERVMRHEPESVWRPLNAQRLKGSAITADAFADPELSPLRTHKWAAISAAIDDEQASRFGLGGYDNAARHAALGEQLRAAGYNPIEQSGVYGGAPEPSWLVFGITPEEAIKIGGEFHQDAVVTNTHMWYTAAAKDPEHAGMAQAFNPDDIKIGVNDPDYVSITPIGGRDVRWSTAYDWEAPHEHVDPRAVDKFGPSADPASPRRSRTASQMAVPVTSHDLEDVQRLVSKLEAGGAKVHSIHAPGKPPAGWALARDHVYFDGVNKMLVRTADPEMVSPHGYSSWVPGHVAATLPKKNPLNGRPAARLTASPLGDKMVHYGGLAVADRDIFSSGVRAFTVDTSGQVPMLQSHSGKLFQDIEGASELPEGTKPPTPLPPNLVRKIEDRFVITADNPLDITPAVRAADTLKSLGVKDEKIIVKVGSDVAKMDYVDPKPARGRMLTQWGKMGDALRRTSRPLPEWIDNFGVKMDAQVRNEAGKLVKIHEANLAPAHAGMAAFMADPDLAEMAQVAGFNTVAMSRRPVDWNPEDIMHQEPAWYIPDGHIALNQAMWSDPNLVAKSVRAQQAENFFNPTLPPDGSAMMAHELGHVAHQGVLRSFPTQGAGDAWNSSVMQKMMDSLGKAGVEAGLSKYGATSLDEFIAEAVAEAFMSPTPRPIALQVYSSLVEAFRANRDALKVGKGWTG